MELTTIRTAAEAHAKALVAGDIERAKQDLHESLLPHVDAMATALPQPLVSSEVMSVEVSDGHATTVTRYAGPNGSVDIRARWQDDADGLRVVEGAPV